jgi:type IV secretory pathway protease TraF
MAANHQKVMLAVAAASVALLAMKPLVSPVPFIIWNASDSVPIGWYLVSKRQPDIGEIAVIRPAEWVQIYASSRGYLPKNVWLLKPIYGIHPSIICRFGRYIFSDGKHIATAQREDRMHRVLPVWKGCHKLKSDEFFVLAKPKNSFDSRYFGPVKRDLIIGIAIPVYVP